MQSLSSRGIHQSTREVRKYCAQHMMVIRVLRAVGYGQKAKPPGFDKHRANASPRTKSEASLQNIVWRGKSTSAPNS